MRESEIASFREKVAKGGDNDCWNWTGGTQSKGYGMLNTDRGTLLVHRVAWILAHPETEETLGRWDLVCHTCDNRRCVNPKHLVCKDSGWNSRDMVNKHRSRNGEDHYLTSLTNETVREIAAHCDEGVLSRPEIGAHYGVTTHWLARLMRGAVWSHVTGIQLVKADGPLVSACPRCGKEVVRRTLHAKLYCSAYCQQAAWKDRQREHRQQPEGAP